MRRSRAAVALLALFAGACSAARAWMPPPAEVLPLPPLTAPAVSAPGASPPFAALRDRLVDAWLAARPRWARLLGLHAHDGKLADYRAEAIARYAAWLREGLAALQRVDAAALSLDDALDLAILRGRAALELFDLEQRRVPRTDPRYYEELFDVSGYLDFPYAPLGERVGRLIEHERAALDQVDHVLANLEPVLSRAIVLTAIKIYRGYGTYLRGDVRRVAGAVGSAAMLARLAAVNEPLAAAAEQVATRLEREWLPRANETAHVLGPERFLGLIAAQEGQSFSLAALEAMAAEDLERNKLAYQQLRQQVAINRPTAATLLGAATRLMEAARRFVVDHDLVTIPTDDLATVTETPPFMRYNAAFLNMPGPFDSVQQGYYYVTLPDPSWPPEEQREYIFPYGTLMATTVHEVYPGHFLQGLWIRRAPTRVQKMADSYSFTEGWAHYGEQLMIEHGFLADDPQYRLGQLADALLRDCRFVVAVGIHARGMSLAEAERRFVDDCFQDRATAREQALRGAFDPGYFAYTLGKLQILALRDEARGRLGARFDLRRFHDALLSHGSPPVALIRERVLAAIAAP